MRILIAGDEKREKILARLAFSHGHSFPDHGPWDQAVLSLPHSQITEELADQLPRGQHIVCGLTSPAFDSLAQKRGWKLHRVLTDETYLRENAALTAEGALCAAMNLSDKAVSDSVCLVIGYGRIGKELTAMLRALHVCSIVTARRKESLEEAGEPAVSMENLFQALPKADMLFNTVPAPVLDKNLLRMLRPKTLLFELASAPYGIDKNAAIDMKLSYHLESGIPGRCFPESAAEKLLSYMEREAEKNE